MWVERHFRDNDEYIDATWSKSHESRKAGLLEIRYLAIPRRSTSLGQEDFDMLGSVECTRLSSTMVADEMTGSEIRIVHTSEDPGNQGRMTSCVCQSLTRAWQREAFSPTCSVSF